MNQVEYWLNKLQEEKKKKETIDYEIDSLIRRRNAIKKNIESYRKQYLKLVINKPIADFDDNFSLMKEVVANGLEIKNDS